VFTYKDSDACRAQFHDTPGHIMQNYQAQMRLTVKLRFLLGVARRITETIGTVGMPVIQEKLGYLASKVGMVEAMMYGIEAAGTMHNGYYIPNRNLIYSAQVVTQELYPQFVSAIRELAGGSLIMLPSSEQDMENPELRAIIRKTQISRAMPADDRVRFLKLAWDVLGSEYASRHLQYEMFYAGAQFVTCGHSFRTCDWDRSMALVDDAVALRLPAQKAA
jgi:4-hydroxyphenylacetate 3-monooxygenase